MNRLTFDASPSLFPLGCRLRLSRLGSDGWPGRARHCYGSVRAKSRAASSRTTSRQGSLPQLFLFVQMPFALFFRRLDFSQLAASWSSILELYLSLLR